MRDASFSSSFSPGAVDVTFSRRRRESAARLTWSMTRTSALKMANTGNWPRHYAMRGDRKKLVDTRPMIGAFQFSPGIDSQVECVAPVQYSICGGTLVRAALCMVCVTEYLSKQVFASFRWCHICLFHSRTCTWAQREEGLRCIRRKLLVHPLLGVTACRTVQICIEDRIALLT